MKPETRKLLQESPEYIQLIEQAYTLHQKTLLHTGWIENYSQLTDQSKTQIGATIHLIVSLTSVGITDYNTIALVLGIETPENKETLQRITL